MTRLTDYLLGDVLDFHDHLRLPLSSLERDGMQGEYRYYGAQGVIDHIDKFIFDGTYILIAEDGANLVTRNEPIAFLVSGQFWVNNHSHVVNGKDGVADDSYIVSMLNRMNIAGFVTGAAQPKLSQQNLKQIKVSLPSYESQRAISAVIANYDNLIENNRRRMALLEESARLLYREWFVRLRFPGHERTRVTNGVPQGWERVPFECALVLQRGFDLPEREWQEGEFPICCSTGIVGYHNEAKAKGPGVFTGRSHSLGVVNYVESDYWPHNTALWVRDFVKVTPLFALFLLREMNLDQYNGGASVPTLDRKAVHRVPVLVPPRGIITLFDEQLTPMFDQLRNFRQQNEKLRAARDLLLPRLMSGEVSV